MRIPYITLVAASAMALGGCAYGLGYGDYGSPYGNYGYGGSRVSVGIGSGYYGGYGGYGGYGYGSPYYGGYGYGSPYYGWNNGYYYPGSGYYVYDSYRRPYAMTTTQRQYWSTRSPALRTATTTRTKVRPNWSSFNRRATTAAQREQTREERRRDRHDNNR